MTANELRKRTQRQKRKYGNQPVTIDGITFDSKAEGERYATLRVLEKTKAIKALELQPRFECVVNGRVVTRYTADFRYLTTDTGEIIVEDVKGIEPPVNKLRRELAEALFAMEVHLVDGNGKRRLPKSRNYRQRRAKR